MNIQTVPLAIKLAILLSLGLALYFVIILNIEENPNPVTLSDSDINDANQNKLQYTVSTPSTGFDLSSIESAFPVNEILQYRIQLDEDIEYSLSVVTYEDDDENHQNAIFYIPNTSEVNNDSINDTQKANQIRLEHWHNSSSVIKKHAKEDALFVTFWDNAQRIHFLTGRDSWLRLPHKNAYEFNEEINLWGTIAGGIDNDEQSVTFSQLLLKDADNAIIELSQLLPKDRDLYLLMCTDDLAHIEELARITGEGIPLETRLFATDSDLHNNITRIKEWAKEGNGTGSYLIQPISERFIRAWRVTDQTFEDSLLVRSLPFSSSLDRLIADTKLVYQTDWGAYISIFQITP